MGAYIDIDMYINMNLHTDKKNIDVCVERHIDMDIGLDIYIWVLYISAREPERRKTGGVETLPSPDSVVDAVVAPLLFQHFQRRNLMGHRALNGIR